jgi:lysozyme family protein
MSTFELSVPVFMAHEGGWCDVKGDRGGETNFGWSTLTIKRLGLTAEDLGVPGPLFVKGYLKPMKRERAIELYRIHFWRAEYGQLNDQIAATKIMDFAIHAGPGHAAQVAQRAAGIPDGGIDGIFGPNTVKAVNLLGNKFVPAMCVTQKKYYDHLIDEDPTQEQFRKNWEQRAAWHG